MNHDTKQSALPALTADFLRSSGCLVDNLFADLWKEVGMKGLLSCLGFQKRSGTPVNEVMFCLMLWVWLKGNSVGMFARESLCTFSAASRDESGRLELAPPAPWDCPPGGSVDVPGRQQQGFCVG